MTATGVHWQITAADVLAGLRNLESNSINCIVTSPPYYWQRDYDIEGQIGHEPAIDGYVKALVSVFAEARRVLSSDGTLFLNLGDTYYSAKGKPHGRDRKHHGRQLSRNTLRAVDGPGLGLPRKSLIGIPWRVALGLQSSGWTLRSHIIWHKPRTSIPEPTAHDRPQRSFEHVFLLSKSPRYYFNRTELPPIEDVWLIEDRPNNPNTHLAPFPAELVDQCLRCGCPPGGAVLDPFMGSGTTLLVSLRKGMRCFGIDIKPQFCEFVAARIREEFGVFSGSGGASDCT